LIYVKLNKIKVIKLVNFGNVAGLHLQNVAYSLILLLFILSLLIYIKFNKTIQKEKSLNLPMVSDSLTPTFNLLTGYYSKQQPSSLWLSDIIFLGMECVGKNSFCVFLEDDSTDLRENFFWGLGGNT